MNLTYVSVASSQKDLNPILLNLSHKHFLKLKVNFGGIYCTCFIKMVPIFIVSVERVPSKALGTEIYICDTLGTDGKVCYVAEVIVTT